MASVLEFKANLLGGGARANQFTVGLSFPSFIGGGSTAARKAQFLCNAAAMPGSSLGITQGVYYRGREVKLPGERQFDNWTIQVMNDTDFAIHDAFEQWSDAINSVADNTGMSNPLSYTVDMTVTQLDRNGAFLKTYSFKDCWPVSVGEIQLSFGQNDQIEEFPVVIAYSYWETF